MRKDIYDKWVAALKSGHYKRGRGFLNVNSCFCCLGVLCDLYIKEHPDKAYWTEAGIAIEGAVPEFEACRLPHEVERWAGITNEGFVHALMVKNDDTPVNKDPTFNCVLPVLDNSWTWRE